MFHCLKVTTLAIFKTFLAAEWMAALFYVWFKVIRRRAKKLPLFSSPSLSLDLSLLPGATQSRLPMVQFFCLIKKNVIKKKV
jgi:hypothetical protein